VRNVAHASVTAVNLQPGRGPVPVLAASLDCWPDEGYLVNRNQIQRNPKVAQHDGPTAATASTPLLQSPHPVAFQGQPSLPRV
jgi:hypothetical protein